jgi:glycosyltransferase involved in cell wall biosynthesis
LTESDGPLHVLRIADVPRNRPGGMHGFMTSSGTALEQRGHRVSYWFSEELNTGRLPRKLRRLAVPWLIAGKVVAAHRAGFRFDVVEIHEPLAVGYSVLRRLTWRRLPPCVVLSYGLEERSWRAYNARLGLSGRKPSTKSRISVPLTILRPARVALRHASAVLVPSSADREYLIHVGHIAPSRVAFVPTGVHRALFDVAPVATESVGLLFIGTWIDRKGTPELVAAWGELVRRHPTLRLTLVGTQVEAPRVLASFPPSSRERVHVYPSVGRERLAELLSCHQIFVLPSWFEGMPLSMLEAAAAGLACVVCSVCGNVDFFREDDPTRDGALLVPAHDSASLVAALERLISDHDLRVMLGNRARARAREFTWEYTAECAELGYRAARSG